MFSSYRFLRNQIYQPFIKRSCLFDRFALPSLPSALWYWQHPLLIASPDWQIAVRDHLEHFLFHAPLLRPVVRCLSTGWPFLRHEQQPVVQIASVAHSQGESCAVSPGAHARDGAYFHLSPALSALPELRPGRQRCRPRTPLENDSSLHLLGFTRIHQFLIIIGHSTRYDPFSGHTRVRQ